MVKSGTKTSGSPSLEPEREGLCSGQEKSDEKISSNQECTLFISKKHQGMSGTFLVWAT
jgi:hypothetical protein